MTVEPGVALRNGIEPLVFPRSLVIVGASERNPRPIEGACRGGATVYLVNPNRSEVLGLPCHPSLGDLPGAVELAFLLVSHTRIEQAVEDALDAGIRALIVPGIGAEAGAEGPPVTQRVRELADAAGAAVIGPNCMGAASPDGPSTWIGTVPDTFVGGHVAVVAQSGSIAEACIATGPRIGFRTVISSGGELNRDAADLLAFLARDEGTRAIGLFLETVRRPAAFAAALEVAAEAGKPVVCLKVGRSDAAARATLAHTGALVGSARAFSALLRRFGAIEVADVHDLFEMLEVLGRKRWPRGPRIAAVSESGGECALLADHGDAVGLPFEPLPDDTASRLQAEFENLVSPENPLDAWAIGDENVVYPRCFDVLAESGAYDVLLGQVDLSQFRGVDEDGWCTMVVKSLADAVDRTDALFGAVTSVHTSDPPPHLARLARDRDLALLRGTAHSLRAIAAVASWHPTLPPESLSTPIELDGLLRPGALPEFESALILERYGVPLAARARAASPEQAATVAEKLGFPVVVKVDGPAHKSAGGGVALGVESAAATHAAASRLGGRVLVARQVHAGPEAICGLSRDPDYGPVLAVGLGGVAVEALSLAAVALAPLDRAAAQRLVAEAPGLAAVASEAALDDLARTLVALGELALHHPEIAEIDVNPLILGPEGATAVDALVVVG